MKKLLNAVPVLAEPRPTQSKASDTGNGEARESTIPTQPNLERPAENRDSRGGVQKPSASGSKLSFKQRRAGYARKYYHADLKSARERNRDQYAAHREARKAARMARYHANPQKELEQKFRKYHNLQPGEQRDKRDHAPYGSMIGVRRAASLKPKIERPPAPAVLAGNDKDWFRLQPQDIPGHWKP